MTNVCFPVVALIFNRKPSAATLVPPLCAGSRQGYTDRIQPSGVFAAARVTYNEGMKPIAPLTPDPDSEDRTLIACHACDALYRLPPLDRRTQALCQRCGTVLARGGEESRDKTHTLALTWTALILWFIANSHPILILRAAGQEQHYTLLSGAWALVRFDLWEVAITIFLTSILFPLLHLLGLIHVLTVIDRPRRPRYFVPLFKHTLALMPWGMIGVYMLGVLVSVVKLADLATVVPGAGVYGLAGQLFFSVASAASLNPHALWHQIDRE